MILDLIIEFRHVNSYIHSMYLIVIQIKHDIKLSVDCNVKNVVFTILYDRRVSVNSLNKHLKNDLR